jgi:hypothetical protein
MTSRERRTPQVITPTSGQDRLTYEYYSADLDARTGENSDLLYEPFPEDFGFDEIDAEGHAWSVTSDDPRPPGS